MTELKKMCSKLFEIAQSLRRSKLLPDKSEPAPTCRGQAKLFKLFFN